MLEELRPLLGDVLIRRSSGDDVWRRGAAYAREGRVTEISWSSSAGEVAAVVIGSQRRSYRAVAGYDRADGPEGLRERHGGGVVGGQVVPQLPDPLEQCGRGMADDARPAPRVQCGPALVGGHRSRGDLPTHPVGDL